MSLIRRKAENAIRTVAQPAGRKSPRRRLVKLLDLPRRSRRQFATFEAFDVQSNVRAATWFCHV